MPPIPIADGDGYIVTRIVCFIAGRSVYIMSIAKQTTVFFCELFYLTGTFG